MARVMAPESTRLAKSVVEQAAQASYPAYSTPQPTGEHKLSSSRCAVPFRQLVG